MGIPNDGRRAEPAEEEKCIHLGAPADAIQLPTQASSTTGEERCDNPKQQHDHGSYQCTAFRASPFVHNAHPTRTGNPVRFRATFGIPCLDWVRL